MSLELDVSTFIQRLDRIHSSFSKNKGSWNNANCLCLNHGSMNEDDVYAKSLVLHNYLFDVELTDTVMLLTDNKDVYFLSSKKKIEFLQQVMTASDKGNFAFYFLVRDKADGNEAHNKKILNIIQSSISDGQSKTKVGVFAKEWNSNQDSANVAGLQKVIDESDVVETVDVAVGFGLALGVKDDEELDLIKKSSVLSNKVLKHGIIPRLEEVIDKEEKITHEALAEEIEAIYQDPSKINLKVPAEQVSTAYFPIIQSGGDYDFRVSAVSNGEKLKYDVITVSLGSRYNNYCSNIARTFLIDPPKAVSDVYELLLQVYEACIEVMVPGKPLKAVYNTAVEKLTELGRNDLVKCLPKNLGFAIGPYFREGSLTLSDKNGVTFKPGMTFNLSIGLNGIPLSEQDRDQTNDASGIKELSEYALLIADTIAVTKTNAEVMTKHNKSLSDISYSIHDGNKSDEDDNESVDVPEAPKGDAEYARKISSDVNKSQRSSKRLAVGYDTQVDIQANAAEREKKQIKLMKRRNEERIRELARAKVRGKGGNDENELAEDIEVYKKTTDYPDNVLPNQIKVDMANKCVLLPIGGNPVPFHISTIKAATVQNLDNVHYLRLNFYSAGLALGKEASKNIGKLVEKYSPYASFIREMTFRSLDGQNLNNAYRMIMELRKRFKAQEIQDEEEATLVKQDKLIRTKNERVPRLSDLTMRPVFAGRKTQGNLEAHSNGLRFISNRGESVDIIYSNIKHAIFQPCENEIMVLIHFHFKHPIMIGKKKQKDLQVFTEVIEASQAVDAGRRNMYDPEEMDDEQRERQLRKKLNDAFKEFCRKVEKVAKNGGFDLEFDIPYRDLGFHGNPHREMVWIMPTLNCLVNLTETPFFVVDLSDVDHVHFERVTFASKAFDIVIINKDFTKQPWRVDMIPNADKESIQDWLTDMEISYTEGPMNLNWKQIMATVAEDDRFYMDTEEDEVTKKEAGWSFLRMYGEDEEEEEEQEEGDSSFDEEEESEEESDEDSEEDFDSESESDSEEDPDDDLEEQGMDWDDMERQAIADDRRKSRRDEEEEAGARMGSKSKRARR